MQGHANIFKVKNESDHKSENIFHETISKSESSDEEKGKNKNDRKRRKSTWKEYTNDNLVDCICFNEYTKKLIFTKDKASKNENLKKEKNFMNIH